MNIFLITHSSTYFLFIFMAPKWPWLIYDLTSVSFITNYKCTFNAKLQSTAILYHNTIIQQHHSVNQNGTEIYMSMTSFWNKPVLVMKYLLRTSLDRTHLVLSFLPKTQKLCVILQKTRQQKNKELRKKTFIAWLTHTYTLIISD